MHVYYPKKITKQLPFELHQPISQSKAATPIQQAPHLTDCHFQWFWQTSKDNQEEGDPLNYIYSYRYISIYIQTKTSTHRPPPPSPFASIFFSFNLWKNKELLPPWKRSAKSCCHQEFHQPYYLSF